MAIGKSIFVRPIIIGLMLVAAIAMTVYLRTTPPPRAIPPELQGVLRPAPKPLRPFSLIDDSGQPFTLEDLQDKWTMLFFGYTYCPDICPTALAILSAVFQRLEQHPGVIPSTRVVFVSVDPQRDRPEKLAEYVAFFDKRFTAATGAVKEIDGLAQQVGAGYQIEPEDASGNYLVSHTGSIFLVDPQARLLGAFSFPHDPETITSQYLRIREL
jgi:protein SCO1/2